MCTWVQSVAIFKGWDKAWKKSTRLQQCNWMQACVYQLMHCHSSSLVYIGLAVLTALAVQCSIAYSESLLPHMFRVESSAFHHWTGWLIAGRRVAIVMLAEHSSFDILTCIHQTPWTSHSYICGIYSWAQLAAVFHRPTCNAARGLFH